MLARIVLSAALAGLVAGFVWSAALSVRVVPLILAAEDYESVTAAEDAQGDHTVARHHAAEIWAPEDGIERTLYTLLGNIVTATGFGLLLTAAFSLRGGPSWREGLLWGAAGFATFHLAPALGLPPELPGAAAAELGARQLWWLSTAVATGLGLALLVPTRKLPLRLSGAALVVLPHLIGVPQPEIHGGLASPDMAHSFVVASLLSNAIFWLVLGAFCAFFFGLPDRTRPPQADVAAA